MEIFVNIAPVSPEKTLTAIERAVQETGEVFAKHQSRFVDLLQKLAYEPELFERCARLLCRVALFEWKNEASNSHQYSDILRSLFYLYFSGTHALIEDRVKIIEELTSSEEQHKQELGFYLLNAALEADYFGAVQDFNFGTRSRDYGYQPRNHEDYSRWFGSVVDACLQIILKDQKLAERTRWLLASKLNGIWTRAQVFDVVEKAARQIHAQKGWHEGWIAAKGIIRDDQKNTDSAIMERLSALEKSLRPVSLLDQARTYAFSGIWQGYDLEDDFEDDSERYRKVEEITRSIACQVAQTPDVLNIMLPELVSAHTDTYHGRLYAFGKGLADGADDKERFFQMLRSEFIRIAPAPRTLYVFTGFLAGCAEIAPDLCNTLLDGLVEDEVLGEWFPLLQESCKIDQAGIKRLHRSLDIGKAPVVAFKNLGWAYAYKYLSDDDLARLVRKILARENGAEVAIEIFSSKFMKHDDDGIISIGLLNVMREAACCYQFCNKARNFDNIKDYQLAQLAKICLNGAESAHAAQVVCQRFVKSVTSPECHQTNNYPRLVQALAQLHPKIFLDEFLDYCQIVAEDIIAKYKLTRIFFDDFSCHKNPLDEIKDNIILDWCDTNPEQRYPLTASLVTCFSTAKEGERIKWRPVVYAILEQAPNVEDILNQFADVIEPKAWSGSLADVLEGRSILLQEFYTHPNKLVRKWAKSQHADLQKKVEYARKSEQEREEQSRRRQNERFE